MLHSQSNSTACGTHRNGGLFRSPLAPRAHGIRGGMPWPFSSPAPVAADPLGPRPKVRCTPAWRVEIFSEEGAPRWAAATTAYELPGFPGERPQQHWERRLYVFGGSEVYLQTQPHRPIRETSELLGAINDGLIMFFPPEGGEVLRDGVIFTVAILHSLVSSEDLALDVVDIQTQLSGGATRESVCQQAIIAWANDPSAENTLRMRESYYAMSRYMRRFLGGMDGKDNAIRNFLEAKDEASRGGWRQCLLDEAKRLAEKRG